MERRLNQFMEGNPTGDNRSLRSNEAKFGRQVYDGLVTLGGGCTDDVNLRLFMRYEMSFCTKTDYLRLLVASNHLFPFQLFWAHHQLGHLIICWGRHACWALVKWQYWRQSFRWASSWYKCPSGYKLGWLKPLRWPSSQTGGQEGEWNGGTSLLRRKILRHGRKSTKCCHEHIYGADGGDGCLQHWRDRREYVGKRLDCFSLPS